MIISSVDSLTEENMQSWKSTRGFKSIIRLDNDKKAARHSIWTDVMMIQSEPIYLMMIQDTRSEPIYLMMIQSDDDSIYKMS